jgi:glutamate dehydrogenase
MIRLLYIQFAMTHYIQAQGAQLMPTLSYQRLHTDQVLSEEELLAKLKRIAANSHDLQVLQSFLTFNKAVLKTK